MACLLREAGTAAEVADHQSRELRHPGQHGPSSPSTETRSCACDLRPPPRLLRELLDVDTASFALLSVGVGSRNIFTLATAVRSDEIDADRTRLLDILDDDAFSTEARPHDEGDSHVIVRSFPLPPAIHNDVVYLLQVVPIELGVYATGCVSGGEGLLFLCGGFSCCSLK